MKLNRIGAVDFSLVVLAIVLLAFGGFVVWRIQAADQTVNETTNLVSRNSTAQDKSQFDAYKLHGSQRRYDSKEIGISFHFPESLGDVTESVNDYSDDGEFADGKVASISFTDSAISIVAATSDHFVTKGPLPVSQLFIAGFDEERVAEIDGYETASAANEVINGRDFVFVESEELFSVPTKTERVFATNLDNSQYAGLVISSYNSDDVDTMRLIAASID